MSSWPASTHATSSWQTSALRVMLRALRFVMSIVYLAAGSMKLAGAPAMVALFGAIGMGQWFRFAIGFLEILGGIALLIPVLAGAAALGLAALMIGATMIQIIISRRPPLASIVSLFAVTLIAWAYRDDTRRLVKQLRRS